MQIVAIYGDIKEFARMGGLQRYRKGAVAAGAAMGLLVAASLVQAFVQPANAMGAYTVPLGSFYGGETAYYCGRYGARGASASRLCQPTALVANTLAADMHLVGAGLAGNCRAYDPLFRRYDWNVDLAEAICQAESGGNPRAVSPTNDYGLMQLHNMAIFDPAQNIAAAYRKYQVQGWDAWTTYTVGSYARFL